MTGCGVSAPEIATFFHTFRQTCRRRCGTQTKEQPIVTARPTLAAIRFGYGLRPGEAPPDDADALLAQVEAGVSERPRFPREGLLGRREAAKRVISLRAAEAKAAREGKPNESIRKETQLEAQRVYRADAMARLVQAVRSPHGFHERLASFWVDHFSTSVLKSLPMRMIVPLYEAEAIRPHLAGPFAQLLSAAVIHPTMLTYLQADRGADPASPAAPVTHRGITEDIGRNLLALHTLGPGASFNDDDIRTAGEILSRLAVDDRALEVAYRPRPAEADPISLLGRSYGGTGEGGQDHLAMLEELAAQPATAMHICRKLAAHFISDDPPQELVEAMVSAWTGSGGTLAAVYRAMVGHSAAWSQPCLKMKQPFDFMVSGLRALDLPDEALSGLLKDMSSDDEEDGPVRRAMQLTGSAETEQDRRRRADEANDLTLGALHRLGQPIWQPPGPAGFPDRVDAWLTAEQLARRIGWSRSAAMRFGHKLEPQDFLEAALADAAAPETRALISQAPSRIHGVTMVLASAEFNRSLAAAPGDGRFVAITLRGAMDGLDLVQPYGDPAFAALRPGLASDPGSGLIDLDGFFGLHPAASALMPLWKAGDLALVHAVSTPYRQERNHLAGQDILESGGKERGIKTGWLNRALAVIPRSDGRKAVDLGGPGELILSGPNTAVAMAPQGVPVLADDEIAALRQLYEQDGAFARAFAAGQAETSAASLLQDHSSPHAASAEVAARAATMLRGDYRVAAFSINGWDTHRDQRLLFASAAEALAAAIAVLKQQLDERIWAKTIVLAATEFGRTARENAAGGTDHGTASVALLAGGAIGGGKVLGDWPGLEEGKLLDGQDLAPTADLREIAAAMLYRQFDITPANLTTKIFPGLSFDAGSRFLRG
eukprot:g7741.t1